MIAWINRDLWSPIWPNLAASALCTSAAVLRIRIHLTRHREVSARQHAATRDLIAGLHQRLDRLGTDEEPQ